MEWHLRLPGLVFVLPEGRRARSALVARSGEQPSAASPVAQRAGGGGVVDVGGGAARALSVAWWRPSCSAHTERGAACVVGARQRYRRDVNMSVTCLQF